MSIYKKVLENQFYDLHPMLQRRYEFKRNSIFKATGVMKCVRGGPMWLFPIFWLGKKYKLFFPESGKNIPFEIVNSQIIASDGTEQVHWERVFYFNHKKRFFNARMYLNSEQNLIQDYLGEPAKFYSDLALSITKEGGLRIDSKKQRLVLPFIEIPLPKIFQGLATVTETYMETKAVYYIQVQVKNPIIGTVFSYEGEFKSNDIF
ncbi:MAG: DUF4166 domain-containing protein [Bacillota bacterium]|nr:MULTISPECIES: DUF4166 domain-containing protein [Bacillaceae]MCC2248382.1 DUF4166 domain-containing protein [Virgibacillus sp. AGTR]